MKNIMFSFMTRDTIRGEGGERFFSQIRANELRQVNDSAFPIIFDNSDGSGYLGIVPMSDIMYGEIKDDYEELCELYGKEKLDAVIVKDEEVVRKKISDTIRLAMDDIHDTDTLTVIFFNKKKDHSGYTMTDVIYSVLQENFTIIDQDTKSWSGLIRITIKKE